MGLANTMRDMIWEVRMFERNRNLVVVSFKFQAFKRLGAASYLPFGLLHASEKYLVIVMHSIRMQKFPRTCEREPLNTRYRQAPCLEVRDCGPVTTFYGYQTHSERSRDLFAYATVRNSTVRQTRSSCYRTDECPIRVCFVHLPYAEFP